MRYRSWLVGLLLLAMTLGVSTAVPAQTSPVRRVIEVTLTEFKFEPNQIVVTEGETVIVRLKNSGPRFAHNLAARYLVNIPLTVRGDGRQAVEEERKFVQVDVGKQAEFEFVAQNRGSHAFICSVFLHSTAGMTGAFFVQPAVR